MVSHRSGEEDRERRMWWVLDENDVPVYAEGLRCTPANPDAWWFPTKGFSVHESQVYGYQDEAKAESRKRLTARRRMLDRQVKALG